MKKLALGLIVTPGVILLLSTVAPSPADAHTCSSACNQIRRACLHVAKATRKVEFAVCDDSRDTCRSDCAATGDNCSTVCAAVDAACLAACAGDLDCEAACAAGTSVCPDDCDGCCLDGRVICRSAAQQVSREARILCDGTREGCRDVCQDPIDGDCVRTCHSAQRICANAAKKTEVACKRQCPDGTARRACVRGCRKEMNDSLGFCSSSEMLCVGGCIGVSVSP